MVEEEEEEQESAKDGRRVGKEVVIDRAHNNLTRNHPKHSC